MLRVEINYDNQSSIRESLRRRTASVWGPHLSQEIGGMELLLSAKTGRRDAARARRRARATLPRAAAEEPLRH